MCRLETVEQTNANLSGELFYFWEKICLRSNPDPKATFPNYRKQNFFPWWWQDFNRGLLAFIEGQIWWGFVAWLDDMIIEGPSGGCGHPEIPKHIQNTTPNQVHVIAIQKAMGSL